MKQRVRTGRRRAHTAFASLAILALSACAQNDAAPAAGASAGAEVETLMMVPEDRANWGARNIFAPVTSLFLGGPSYWYGKRELFIDTTPSGGFVDLFYVRAGFQKQYEQAETPLRVVLPPRIDTTDRDRLEVRAFVEGYRQVERILPVQTRKRELIIELSPLPNTLETLAHRYFAGRASLRFITRELLLPRVQEARDGFSVILTETALGESAEAEVAGLRSPQIESVRAEQLGEDLLLRFTLTDAYHGRVQLRSRQAYNEVREIHEFDVDVVPSDGGVEAVTAAISALAAVRERDVTGCALHFEDALVEALDPGALRRALTPAGSFTDRYLRAAMRRLGELAPNRAISFRDGSLFRTSVPIELEAAMLQAADARGYLALLRRFVAHLERPDDRDATLRGLLAPESSAERFGRALVEASSREAQCVGGAP